MPTERPDEKRSVQLHSRSVWILPLFFIGVWCSGLASAMLPGMGGAGREFRQAAFMVGTFLPGTSVACIAPRVTAGISRSTTRLWLHIAIVLASLAATYSIAVQVPILLARYVVAVMGSLLHMKVIEILVCLDCFCHASRSSTAELEKAYDRTLRGKMLAQAHPLQRAAFVIFVVDVMCVDFIEHDLRWALVYWPLVRDVICLACLVCSFLLALGGVQYGMGLHVHPVLLSYVEMLCTYPLLCCLVWTAVVPFFLLSGGLLPRHRAGHFPFASASFREFWGRRYNCLVSDLCRRSIFDPLVADLGLSAALASFLVFTVTGLLHAVPIALLPHSDLWHVLGQLAFFWLNWGVCVLETTFKWRGSTLRSAALFSALFPLFGVSTIDACVLHPDMRISRFFSERNWDALRGALGIGSQGAL